MAHSSPAIIGTGLQVTLRLGGIYVVLTSIGFTIWKTTGDDAGYQLVALFVGFVLAAIVLAVGAIVAFCRRHAEVGMLALLFVAWALISGWSVLSRLAIAEN